MVEKGGGSSGYSHASSRSIPAGCPRTKVGTDGECRRLATGSLGPSPDASRPVRSIGSIVAGVCRDAMLSVMTFPAPNQPPSTRARA